MLRYAIVTTVQHTELHVISQLIEYVVHHVPCASLVVVKQPTNILKQEHLRLRLLHHTGKLIEQRSTSILKAQPVSHHRKRLTGRTANHEVHMPLVSSGIEVADVRKPIFLFNIVIGKVTLLALRLNVASKHYPMP